MTAEKPAKMYAPGSLLPESSVNRCREKGKRWLEYRIFVPDEVPEKVTRMAAIISERYGLHVRRITRKILAP